MVAVLYDHRMHDISSKEKENYTHDWAQTSAKPPKDELVTHGFKRIEDKDLLLDSIDKQSYESNIGEDCTAAFIKYQTLINYIIVGKHIRSVEKTSLVDTATTIYYSKLEEVGSWRTISLNFTLKQKRNEDLNIFSEGWGLLKCRTHKDFSKKHHEYLQKKFDEGIVSVKYWKLKEIVWDMATMKANEEFCFSADDILKENQVHSYFTWMKRGILLVASQNSSITEKPEDNVDNQVESDINLIGGDIGDTKVDFEEIEISDKLPFRDKQAHELNTNGSEWLVKCIQIQ